MINVKQLQQKISQTKVKKFCQLFCLLFLYFKMKYNNKKDETSVIVLASNIEILFTKIPYINQKIIPIKNIKNMGNENPETSLVFQVL